MNILLADHNALMREGLKSVLLDFEPEVAVREATDADGASAAMSDAGSVELALVDIDLPGLEGSTGLARLHKAHATCPIVALAESGGRADVVGAFEAGAVGFLPKTLPVEVLIGALRLILAGGTYAPPEMLTTMAVGAAFDRQLPSDGLASELTPRQLDVLACLAQGRSNREIATELGLSESTVKVHVNRILKTLQVKNRSQAALTANGMSIAAVRTA
jgi:DNA-binding NarL/FixJ family response regulator